jgi:hypothetical protein
VVAPKTTSTTSPPTSIATGWAGSAAGASVIRALVVVLVLWALPARADRLSDGQAALLRGDYVGAATLAEPLTRDPSLPPGTRTEAARVYGLALAALDRRAEAETVLLGYLESEPDAHLDPALYPPDLVVFFEDVRARHAGQLLTAKPRPKRKQYAILNFVPAYGQIQNGEPVKAWIVGGAEAVFLATNLTTFALLHSSCDGQTLVCDDPDRARRLRTVNLVSGGLLLAAYAVGVIDGFVGYRSDAPAEPATRVGIEPVPSGGVGFVSGRF